MSDFETFDTPLQFRGDSVRIEGVLFQCAQNPRISKCEIRYKFIDNHIRTVGFDRRRDQTVIDWHIT